MAEDPNKNEDKFEENSLEFIANEIIPKENEEKTGKKENEMGNNLITKLGAKYLQQKYGWILSADEQESEDEDEEMSILEELEINPKKLVEKSLAIFQPSKNYNIFGEKDYLPDYENQKLNSDSNLIDMEDDSDDFWGPLICSLLFSVFSSSLKFKGTIWIIFVWFVGSLFISYVSTFLGSKCSFSRALSIIGYSLTPMTIANILNLLLFYFLGNSVTFFSYLIFFFSILYSTYCASTLIPQIDFHVSGKKYLLAYPIFLLFVYLISL
ncbi:golgi membrane protein yip1 [Anaeramoeba ignava]|uniref:Protein YIPF n=1 Tax=Anaeramoeba ignava TaxID=1746090 RepID=A0A9Q0R7X4_ANAIG|nr:golgi membrane protein yip1 [Anaeramoeba ignava]